MNKIHKTNWKYPCIVFAKSLFINSVPRQESLQILLVSKEYPQIIPLFKSTIKFNSLRYELKKSKRHKKWLLKILNKKISTNIYYLKKYIKIDAIIPKKNNEPFGLIENNNNRKIIIIGMFFFKVNNEKS